MPARFTCSCGMAFTIGTVRPGRPVVCPACGAVQKPSAGVLEVVRRPATPPRSVPETDVGRPTLRCPKCGALNSADDALCGLCGQRLSMDLILMQGAAEARPAKRPAPAEGPRERDDFEAPDEPEDQVEFLETFPGEEPVKRRQPIRYEGEDYVPMVRLVLRTLVRPRSEMETLVSFLSHRDMGWKLLILFLLGVGGLWLAGWMYPGLPLVSGFTFGGGLPRGSPWYYWLGMAFTAGAFITVGLTVLSALAGLLTGHGWQLSPLALAFFFVVSLVNLLHLLILPIGVLSPGLAHALAWVLLGYEVLLTIVVISRVLDCDPILAVIIAVAICTATVHFYNRIYKLTEKIAPGLGGPPVGAMFAPSGRPPEQAEAWRARSR